MSRLSQICLICEHSQCKLQMYMKYCIFKGCSQVCLRLRGCSARFDRHESAFIGKAMNKYMMRYSFEKKIENVSHLTLKLSYRPFSLQFFYILKGMPNIGLSSADTFWQIYLVRGSLSTVRKIDTINEFLKMYICRPFLQLCSEILSHDLFEKRGCVLHSLYLHCEEDLLLS